MESQPTVINYTTRVEPARAVHGSAERRTCRHVFPSEPDAVSISRCAGLARCPTPLSHHLRAADAASDWDLEFWPAGRSGTASGCVEFELHPAFGQVPDGEFVYVQATAALFGTDWELGGGHPELLCRLKQPLASAGAAGDLHWCVPLKRGRKFSEFSVEITATWQRAEKVTRLPSDGSICEALARMAKSGEFSDVCLIAGETEFRTHRVVLAARSPYFRDLFAEQFTGSGSYNLVIDKVAPRVLGICLEYMYTDSVGMVDCFRFDFGLWTAVAEAACHFRMVGLAAQVLNIIGLNIRSGNVAECLRCAGDIFPIRQLATEYMDLHYTAPEDTAQKAPEDVIVIDDDDDDVRFADD